MYLKAKTFVRTSNRRLIKHFWSEAPDYLAHLRRPHEHWVEVIVGIEARDENREIACEDLRAWIDKIFDSFPAIIPWSCETIARKIATKMSKNNPIFKTGTNPKLKGREFIIEVWEDEHQGGSVRGTFEP